MKKLSGINSFSLSSAIVFITSGLFLISISDQLKTFSDNEIIWDIQWLRAYTLLFFLTLVIIWKSNLKQEIKYLFLLGLFSFFFIVANSLVFAGTPFSYNGFWGDQKFRQAMILKFSEFFRPSDFYYKDLPPFYPPFYYQLLSIFARLFSVEAYKMLKIGTYLIYLCGPLLLYYFWTNIVNKLRAFTITIFTFLFYSSAPFILFSSPHEALSAMFFVPWWILYIEQLKNKEIDWKFYVFGGLIGGLLFMTYYYPFFIGGLYLLIRTTIPGSKYIIGNQNMSILRSWLIMFASAIVSLPYWLPLLISMSSYGSDPAQQEWFRKGYALALPGFFEFSIYGIASLTAIIMAFKHYSKPIYKQIVSFVIIVFVFLIIGNVLGNIGIPILYPKADEFLIAIAGLAVGLVSATLLRKRNSRGKIGTGAVLVMVLILFMLVNFSRFVDHRMVKVARQSWAYHWDTDKGEMEQRRGSVFLTGEATFPSFYPVYTFIASNEHYSHHASRFKARYYFLNHLQHVKDSYLFSLALRNNKFDRVDYFMPLLKDSTFIIPVNWSSYPNKFRTKKMTYPIDLVDDTTLFKKRKGANLYEVLQHTITEKIRWNYIGSHEDSLLHLYRLRLLSDDLGVSGQNKMSEYLDEDWSGWEKLDATSRGFSIHPYFTSLSTYSVRANDSVHVMIGFVPLRDFRYNRKVFLHLFEDASDKFMNLDLMPEQGTSKWMMGDVVLLKRSFVSRAKNFRIEYGLY